MDSLDLLRQYYTQPQQPQPDNEELKQGMALAALTDAWTGSKFSPTFQAMAKQQPKQKDPLDRLRQLATLEQYARQNQQAADRMAFQREQFDFQKKKWAKELEEDAAGGPTKPLTGEQQKRLDLIETGMAGIQGMREALEGLPQRTAAEEFLGIDAELAPDYVRKLTFQGDNPFSFSRNQFVEAFGRMSSGAAISKTEEDRFRQFAPTLRDSPEMRRAKLDVMQKLLNRRLENLRSGKTIPFKAEDFTVKGVGESGAKREPSAANTSASRKLDMIRKKRGQ